MTYPMTDTAQQASPLGDFEGLTIHSSGVEMPGASGGLNKALHVDALSLHHGDVGVIAIEYEVRKVRFDPIKDTDGVMRVHVLGVTNATVIDPSVVAEAMEAQRVKVEEAQGVHRLPYAVDPDDPDTEGDEDE
jgi:hypothetical protein